MTFLNTPTPWENVGIEPPKWLTTEGFKPKYKPPAEYFNWIFNKYTACILELQKATIDFGDSKADADHRHDNVTSENDGFMSKEDKEKLDELIKTGGGVKDYNDLTNRPNLVRRPIDESSNTSSFDVLVADGIVQSKSTGKDRPSSDQWAGSSGFVAGDITSNLKKLTNVISAGTINETASTPHTVSNIFNAGYLMINQGGNNPYTLSNSLFLGNVHLLLGQELGNKIATSIISTMDISYFSGSVENSIILASGTTSNLEQATVIPKTAKIKNSIMIGKNNRLSENSEGEFMLWAGSNNVYTPDPYDRIGGCGIIGGYDCQVSGSRYIGVGRSLIIQEGQSVFGEANKEPVNPAPNREIFTIANGQYNSSSGIIRSNAMRVMRDGNIYATKAFNATGADYAEMFEWLDGNPNNEDRRGLFVTLDGECIKLATEKDEYILGIISASPSVVGDNFADDWKGKYKRDIFGSRVLDDDGNFILSDDYDKEQDNNYTSRDQRKEWAAVGMMGKLIVCDDGTCEVNGYCRPLKDGIASKSQSGYRVMKRIDENHIKILV